MAPDPLITIFTCPKPFTNPLIGLIQRNAIFSWKHLGEDVCVFILGDEPGTADFAAQSEIQHLPWVVSNPLGTPLVSSVFAVAHQMSVTPLLAYVSADIVLTPQFVEVARKVYSQVHEFVIVGQRHDLKLERALDFFDGWDLYLRSDVQIRGRLHPPSGCDYFIFTRACYTNLPNFSIGRGGWDNWMLYHARSKGFPIVDATPSIIAIHQDHDYSHLPNGQPHYRLPESAENIRLAGGPRTMFTLADADCVIRDGMLEHIPLRPRRLLREIEIFPLTRLHSKSLASAFYAAFHPINALKESRLNGVRKSKRTNHYA